MNKKQRVDDGAPNNATVIDLLESDEDEDSAEAAATVEATAEAATGGQNETVPFQAAGGDEED